MVVYRLERRERWCRPARRVLAKMRRRNRGRRGGERGKSPGKDERDGYFEFAGSSSDGWVSACRTSGDYCGREESAADLFCGCGGRTSHAVRDAGREVAADRYG